MSSILVNDTLPGRTLFVAESWSNDPDPTTEFTTIDAALVQAATMSPTSADPVVIVIYPGTYAEALVLVSNVHLFAYTRRSVIVTGNVTWTLGFGVNLPQALDHEEISVVNIRFNAPISIDSTHKPETVQTTAFDGRSVDIRGGLTVASRNDRKDHLQLWDSTIICAVSCTNTIVNLSGCTYLSMAFHGACDVDIAGDQSFSAIALTDTSQCAIAGMQIIGAINVGAGCSLEVVGSMLEPSCTLTVASGGKAEIRSSTYKSNAQLVGPGTINRSMWAITFGPTVPGNNTVPVNPPYADAVYNVMIEPAQVVPAVSSKTSGSFVINDPAGGHIFNMTLLKP